MRQLIGLVAPLVFGGPFTLAGDITLARDTELESRVDGYLKNYVDLALFDGAVLVARGGEVLALRTYGMSDYATGTPNTIQTRFRIASVSKLFTEMAIAKLIETGKLRFDAKLSEFLPDLPEADSITVEHLLHHRAGIVHTNEIFDQLEKKNYRLAEIIETIQGQPLDFEPGTRFKYSNGGYAVLAYIIEQVSGQDYSRYIKSQILDPLGLTDTGHIGHDPSVQGLAVGHVPDPASLTGRTAAPYVEMTVKVGGGTFYSTASDLLRLTRGLFEDGILKQASYRRLFPDTETQAVFSGRSPGYNAYVLRQLDEDVTVIMLSNNYASAMLQPISEALAAMATGERVSDPLVVPAPAISDDILSKYEGSYRSPDGVTLELRNRDGQLALFAGGQFQEILVPQSEDRFLYRSLWAEVQFAETEAGIAGARMRVLWSGEEAFIERID